MRRSPTLAFAATALFALSACSTMVDTQGIAPEPPPTPTGITALAGDGMATVTWNLVDSRDVSAYEVLQGTTSGALSPVGRTPADATELAVSGLTNDTRYYFAVRALDSAGTPSALSAEASAMPFVPDVVAPTLAATIPGSAATGVSVDSTLTVTFSEPMDVFTVSLALTPPVALEAPAWNAAGTEVTFTPVAPLDAETAYAVTVAGSDPSGNPLAGTTAFSFTTVGIPPTVQSTTPTDGATGVPTSATLELVFSEPMDTASVQAALSASPAITCTTWNWQAGNALLGCVHSAALSASTTYTVTLGTGARDAAGTNLAAAKVFSFTTAAAPDTQPPTVASTSPVAASYANPLAANVTVTFSEDVDKASAQAAFQILSPAGHNTGSFTWTDGRTMVFNPDTNFVLSDYVSCRVSTAVKDLAGNYLAANYNFGFTVVRPGSMNIYSSAALDGWIWSSNSQPYTTSTYVYTGDNSINAYSRSFVSFDLSALPSTTTAITAATLNLYQESLSGSPYALGSLYTERVDYGAALDFADLTIAPKQHLSKIVQICDPFCHLVAQYADDLYTLSTTTTTGWKSVGVLTSAANAFSGRAANGNRCQFRMRFATNTDSDGFQDWAVLTSGDAASNRPYLYVSYEY